ncbi:MAG: tetratricopeptide repeat protein [Chloroflexota bacterium]
MNEEARSIHIGHRDYYLQLAEQADAAWRTGQHEHWLERLDSEADNFRAALEWSKSRPDDTAALTRLTVALARYWEFTGRFTEARQWVKEALAEPAPPVQRIRALIAGAQLASYLGDFDAANALLTEGRDLAQQHHDRHGEAQIAMHRGQVALTRGDFPAAVAAHLEGLERWRTLGDDEHAANSLTQLGMASLLQSDLPTANERLEEALALCRTVDTPFHLADALQALGFVRFLMGDPKGALPLLAEGLTLFHRLGAQPQIATGLDEYAFVAGTLGHPMESATLLGAAAALRERIGIPRPAAYDHLYHQLVDGLRAVLGANPLREAMTASSVLSADEAVAMAIAFGA